MQSSSSCYLFHCEFPGGWNILLARIGYMYAIWCTIRPRLSLVRGDNRNWTVAQTLSSLVHSSLKIHCSYTLMLKITWGIAKQPQCCARSRPSQRSKYTGCGTADAWMHCSIESAFIKKYASYACTQIWRPCKHWTRLLAIAMSIGVIPRPGGACRGDHQMDLHCKSFSLTTVRYHPYAIQWFIWLGWAVRL